MAALVPDCLDEPTDGKTAGLMFGIDSTVILSSWIESRMIKPNLAVKLRADRDTVYEWVEPAMRATTTAASIAGGGALPRLNLVVIEESIGGGEGGRDGS